MSQLRQVERRTPVSSPWPCSDTQQGRSCLLLGLLLWPDWLRGIWCDPAVTLTPCCCERERDREREGERERTARRLGNPLNLWTSFRHSFLLQVYLMLHVCLKVSWQEINLWMIHRTIRHNLHPYIHPFLKLVTVYPPAFLYHYLLHTVQFTYSSVFDGILTLVVSVFWFFCHEKTSLSCWFVVIWHFPLNFNETERARWLLDRYTMLKLVKNEERILVSWNILCKCCALV